MPQKEIIRQTLDGSDMIYQRYLDDLSDADLLVRPGEGMNHLAWQIGHLISSERMFHEQIKPGAAPALPEGFDAAHSKEAATSDDASKFLPKAEYLRLWKAQRDALKATLASMSEEQLDAPGPERWRMLAPTVGGIINFAGSHALMHCGQFVGTRRKLGKPVVI